MPLIGPRTERKLETAPRCAVPFRPRKKKTRQAKFHRCTRCGAQVRRRSVRCKSVAPSRRNASEAREGPVP